MRQISALGLALVGVFVLLCLGGVGALCSLAVAPALMDEADEIADMSTTPDVQDGEKAALTGILTGNAIVKSDPDMGQIASYGVVAYHVERYERTSSGSGSSRRTNGHWEEVRVVVDTLKMDVNGTTVTFYGDTGTDLSGNMHNFQEDSSPSVGDRRVVGFRDGDQVTMVGKRTGDVFLADKLYGGPRDKLVSDTRTAAKVFRYIGYGTMVCGGLVAAALLGTAFLLFMRRTPKVTPPSGPSMWPPVPPASS